ncbi:hypothetical protein EUGRSUZ_L03640 [Eucalyptus grandis]|uniref:Uncharacterized protein n=1 Tax=Eucalyptus grandis TaxID=71139 RepID=A0AAD9T6K2_EUCGR|nr:hypothetical protein EUGRSUZ_L03640 [Eucalyptus grandis]
MTGGRRPGSRSGKRGTGSSTAAFRRLRSKDKAASFLGNGAVSESEATVGVFEGSERAWTTRKLEGLRKIKPTGHRSSLFFMRNVVVLICVVEGQRKVLDQ